MGYFCTPADQHAGTKNFEKIHFHFRIGLLLTLFLDLLSITFTDRVFLGF